MPRLTDPDRLAAYRDALGNWAVADYIRFTLPERAERFIDRELGCIRHSEIGRLMYEYVVAGGEIDEVREKEWTDWAEQHEFHFDLRFTIHDKPVYIETRLHYRLPVVAEESWIEVVNIHAP